MRISPVFNFNLNYSDIDESAKLYIDATGNKGIAVVVFGVNSSYNLEHLVTGKDGSVTIPTLKGYYDSGIKQFLVVVVNSTHNGTDYLGNTDIELKMEVIIEENDYNYCSFQIFTVYDINAVGTIAGTYEFSDDRPINWGYTGQMVNGTFIGTATPTDERGNTYTGSIDVSVDETGVISNYSI